MILIHQLKYLYKMTLSDYLNLYNIELQNIYPEQEINSIFQIICEDLFKWSRSEYLIKSRTELNHLQQEILHNALQELKTSKPVQYITGKAHFYGNDFKVTPATLIPRQETEELVDLIIKDHKNKNDLKIIDIGTGTGCIAISLAQNLKGSKVTMIDVSKETLEIAQANADELGVDVKAIKEDVLLLSNDQLVGFDIIVSNPPYVRELEKVELHKNVLEHEPHTALFVENDDPLVFYRKILELAQHGLKNTGILYFEINQYLSQETHSLAESFGFKSELFQDLNDNWRMMRCRK